MPRKACYWTRKEELQLVEFVKQNDCIWKPLRNTNYYIRMKYQAYAKFAGLIDRGCTARSVRDRWVNIRSTFNNYLRKVKRSKLTAKTNSEVYIPSWPLWKPLQFLCDTANPEELPGDKEDSGSTIKEEIQSDLEENKVLIRQNNVRPYKTRLTSKPKMKMDKCKRILNELTVAMKPLNTVLPQEVHYQSYWFFGRHVTERLNAMNAQDADCAIREIQTLLRQWQNKPT